MEHSVIGTIVRPELPIKNLTQKGCTIRLFHIFKKTKLPKIQCQAVVNRFIFSSNELGPMFLFLQVGACLRMKCGNISNGWRA